MRMKLVLRGYEVNIGYKCMNKWWSIDIYVLDYKGGFILFSYVE